MTTFYVKRPGQYSDDAEPISGPGGNDILGDLNADRDDWSLHLPHQCEAWEIGYGTREETLADARAFRDQLDEAIRWLEQQECDAGG